MTRLVLAILLLIGAGYYVGAQAQWHKVGMLNLLDRLWRGPSGEMVAQDIPFGDDPAQRIDIFAPKAAGAGRAGSALPVVIWFHGGGWVDGSRPVYGFAGRAFAAEGFVTVVPGYRLAPAHHFPAFMEDAAAAIRWTRANIARFGGDPDRIILAGQSAGAHIAALAVLDRQWLGEEGDAGGPIRGVVGISGPYDFLPFEPGGFADVAMGDVRPAERTQPIHFVRPGVPPMLLVTGDADVVVRPRNTRHLAAALVAAGNRVETRYYPGVDHASTAMALSLPYRGRAPVLTDAVRFARQQTTAPQTAAANSPVP